MFWRRKEIYTIVSTHGSNGAIELFEKVNANLGKGWKVQGGISVVHTMIGGNQYDFKTIESYYQAMVRG